ncbi:MAG: tRNA (adenosine(37)-N6)-threonylcarbamoyltransferase complex dimerization subunit type 1 TsaB [Chloroflexi bacterium]|nr:tRNA (adenosine(37)-N6)-threonylcarbamoyltransferase complex dimerization subunit type 1 TsaB [Chloroflexota bacterium]
MILAIDTSTRNAGVALAQEGRVISSRSWRSAVNHTSELMPAVSYLLEGAGLKVHDLDGFVVALGPGGFSALRVGMSVAKGLAIATGKPLAGIGTLDAEAQPYLQSGLPVCALLDAGRSEVSSGYFGADGQRLREDRICPPEELAEELAGQLLICGEGARSHAEILRERLGSNAVLAGHSPASRLWALAELGQQRLDSNETDDVATLQPNYLRMPTIGGPKRRDRVRQG